MRAAWASVGLLLLVGGAWPVSAIPQEKPWPVAADETLYFHLNGFQDFPINTQEPDSSYDDSSGLGLLTTTLTCVGQGTGQPLLEQAYNKVYGFGHPYLVQYNVTKDGTPRINPVRGLNSDIFWDAGQGARVFWYVETQWTPGDSDGLTPDPQVVPAVVPQVKVRATIRMGDALSNNDIAYDSGPLLATGESSPQLLFPSAAVNPSYFQTSAGHHGFGFEVPLTIVSPSIPKATGYNVRIDVYEYNPICPDPAQKSLDLNRLRSHTSPGHRPRMNLVLRNALEPGNLTATVQPDGQVHIAAWANSPLGNYDVASIELLGISGPIRADNITFAPPPKKYHCHCYDDPEQETRNWLWNAAGDRAPPGTYVAYIRATNLQGTASFEQRVEFLYGEPSPKMPTPAWLLVVGLTGAALLLRRRA